MNKGLIISIIGICLLFLFGWCSIQVSKEVSGAFEDLSDKLEASAVLKNQNLENRYENFLASLNTIGITNTITTDQLSDSVQSIYQDYNSIIQELENHILYLEENVIQLDPQTGEYLNKTELELNYTYWMGTAPTENEGRGNGQAILLRNRLDYFSKKIEILNEGIAKDIELNSWYIPQQIENPALGNTEKSWEEYTFDAPVIANLAVIEALKLDVVEKVEKEFDFLEKITEKGQ